MKRIFLLFALFLALLIPAESVAGPFMVLPKRGSAWSGWNDPSDTPGLVLWYRADSITPVSDGTGVASWTDGSSSANHAVQETADDKPMYYSNIQNDLPALKFDGNRHFDGTSNLDLSGTQGFTLFLVMKYGGYNQVPFSHGTSNYPQSDANDWLQTTSWGNVGVSVGRLDSAVTLNTTYVTTHLVDRSLTSAEAKVWVNTTAGAAVSGWDNNNTNNLGNNAFTIGQYAGGGYQFNGYLMEIIAYSSALSDADREQVRDYLNAKWAVYE